MSAEGFHEGPHLPARTTADDRLESVLLLTTNGSMRHHISIGRTLAAGLPAPSIVPAFNGRHLSTCLRALRSIDATIALYNRSAPVDQCGLDEVRELGVSPPFDPWAPWPGTRWQQGQLRTDGGGDPLCSNLTLWGQLGVAVTHLRAWERLSHRNGTAFSLVLEDDVIFAEVPGDNNQSSGQLPPAPRPRREHWYDMLRQDVLPHVPRNCHFIFVGYCYGYGSSRTALVVPGGRWCNHAYALTPPGARHLMRALKAAPITEPFGEHVERMSAWWQQRKTAKWRPRSGLRMPLDFFTVRLLPFSLRACAISRQKAVRDGLVTKATFSARPERAAGLVFQDRRLGTTLTTAPAGMTEQDEDPVGTTMNLEGRAPAG